MKKNAAVALASVFALALPGCVSRSYNTGAQVEDLGTEDSISNLDGNGTTGAKLGLGNNEVALTLDDGPEPESLAIAQWLSGRGIPVTYFMIGRNVAANKSTALAIAKLPHVIIANHSWSHINKSGSVVCIACDGASWAVSQVKDADDVLKPIYDANGTKFFFFRAPGGNFFVSNAAPGQKAQDRRDLATLNASIGAKYVGPVRWDVDGDVNPSADGGCGSSSARACADIYLKQVRALGNKPIVILAHDIHPTARDMVKLLVADLEAMGKKFVALDKNPAAVKAIGNVDTSVNSQEFGTTSFDFVRKGPAHYEFDAKALGAVRTELWVDRKTDAPLLKASGEHLHGEYKFSSPGVRFFTVKGYDASGKLIAQKQSEARIDP